MPACLLLSSACSLVPGTHGVNSLPRSHRRRVISRLRTRLSACTRLTRDVLAKRHTQYGEGLHVVPYCHGHHTCRLMAFALGHRHRCCLAWQQRHALTPRYTILRRYCWCREEVLRAVPPTAVQLRMQRLVGGRAGWERCHP